MRVRNAAFAVLLFGVIAPASTQAVPLTVLNPSFESPALDVGVYTVGTAAGWTVTSDAGVWNPDPLFWFSSPVPGGDQVAWSNGGTFSQTLSATLQSDTSYTLTVAVGAQLYAPFAGYQVALYAGSTLLGSESSLSPAPGTFLTSTLIFTSASSDPSAGQPLRIELSSSSGFQTDFDTVSLDAAAASAPVPEPATLSLLGMGLLCVGRSRLKRGRVVGRAPVSREDRRPKFEPVHE